MNLLQQALTQIRNLIEFGWTKSALARNSKGRFTTIDSNDIVAVCLVGAIERLNANDTMKSECRNALGHVLTLTTGRHTSLAYFNDKIAKNKSDIIKLIDKTIEEVADEPSNT